MTHPWPDGYQNEYEDFFNSDEVRDYLNESADPFHKELRWIELQEQFDEMVNEDHEDMSYEEGAVDPDDWMNWYDRAAAVDEHYQAEMDYEWDCTLEYVRRHGRSENWLVFEPCYEIDLLEGGFCCEWCGEKRGQYLLLGDAGDNEESGQVKKVCGPNCPSRLGDSRRLGWYPQAGFPLPWLSLPAPRDRTIIRTNDTWLQRQPPVRPEDVF